MKDLCRKALLIGMGAAEFTRETLARAVADLEKRGEMSRAEAEKVMRSFARTARERRGELEDGIERAVAAMLGKMHLATTDRMEELEKRLRTLERKSRAKR
jgi:polyhydroxyalkanoate synthesis regulator phasin